MDEKVKWAAAELAQLSKEGFAARLKRWETAEEVLKEHFAEHPLESHIAVEGGVITARRGTRTTLDQKKVKVLIGSDLAQFEKTSPTLGVRFEAAAR